MLPFIFSLHFNAASSKRARGCEVLVSSTASKEDDKIADLITDILNERLDIKERHNDGIKTVTKGQRGSLMLNSLNDIGAISVLIEPCFANYATPESQAIFEHEDRYAEIITECAHLTVSKNLPEIDL